MPPSRPGLYELRKKGSHEISNRYYSDGSEIDGKAHRGTYWIAGKILTVSTGMGGKSKQVGSTSAEILAKQLLQELAKEGKA